MGAVTTVATVAAVAPQRQQTGTAAVAAVAGRVDDVDHRQRAVGVVGDIPTGAVRADRHPARLRTHPDSRRHRVGRAVGAGTAVTAVPREESAAPAVAAVGDGDPRAAVAAVAEPASRPAVTAVVTVTTVTE